MSRPFTPLVALVVAATLVSQGCAGRVSENNRRGILLVGGAAAFMGAIIAGDGLACDETFGGPNGTEDCSEDTGDLVSGGIMVGAGLALVGFGLWLKQESAPPPAAAPPPLATDAKSEPPTDEPAN